MGTITKALQLLDLFSRVRPELGLGEFVRLSGRDKATVHRHLVELEQNGFLEQNQTTRAYRLGPALLRLSGVREVTYPIRRLIRPIVTALSDETGELAHFSLLQGMALSPVVHADPQRHGTQVHFDESEILPLHATSSGLAVLAFSDATFRNKVLSRPLTAFTTHTPVDPAAILALLEATRRMGLSRLDRGYDDEVVSQAAPIFGPSSEVLGALSVAVPVVRAKPEYLHGIVTALLDAARSASRSLGGDFSIAISDVPADAPRHRPASSPSQGTS